MKNEILMHHLGKTKVLKLLNCKEVQSFPEKFGNVYRYLRQP